ETAHLMTEFRQRLIIGWSESSCHSGNWVVPQLQLYRITTYDFIKKNGALAKVNVILSLRRISRVADICIKHRQ
ncbi:MAG TPA: hypothetical protein VIJ38_19105, partial [Acidobacteriaceae bacterium]